MNATKWVEDLGFEEDPYRKRDPFEIPENRIIWNRTDLNEFMTDQIDPLLDKVENLYGAGLLIHGYLGSGKTWLCRFLSKSVKERIRKKYGKDPLIFQAHLKTEWRGLEFLYKDLVEDLYRKGFFDELKKYLDSLKEEQKTQIPSEGIIESKREEIAEEWVKEKLRAVTEHQYLTEALFSLWKAKETDVIWAWLRAESVPISDLREYNIYSKIGTDYDRFKTLSAMISVAKEMYPTVVLILDELRNMEEAKARELSEYLRELIDAHYERLFLLCTFTTTELDELYDLGYTAAFVDRLDNISRIDIIMAEAAPVFLREHHKVYRKHDFKIKDQLHPFSEKGIKKLVEILKPVKKVPRFILMNGGSLVKKFVSSEAKLIDEKFIMDNLSILKSDDLSEEILKQSKK